MRTFKITALAVIAALFGLLVLSGCGADDNGVNYMGSTSCKRSKILNDKANDAGVFVPGNVQDLAKQHCKDGDKADETTLPNRLYPQGVDQQACAGNMSTDHTQQAKCISAWADYAVYSLNSPPECIKPFNQQQLNETNSPDYRSDMVTCSIARGQKKTKSSNIGAGIGYAIGGVLVLGVVILFLAVGGGPLGPGYNRS